MINNKASGRLIARLRQERGLTQQQLATIIGVSHQAVSKWESGAALPDIQTMMELTRFFGITVEQLMYAEMNEEAAEEAVAEEPMQEEKEMKHMTIQQLLQMAPFMSKEAVFEIAMSIETTITANQLARLAPHLKAEALEQLIEKNGITLTWESLKKIAPFMNRDTVDELARQVASGEKTIGRESDRFDKAMNDIGKAFDSVGKDMGKVLDDIGRGMEKAFNKAVKFGEGVINDVSEAFSESKKEKAAAETPARSERMRDIRRKAFERAITDEKWDWIAAHLDEIEGDAELKSKIADKAFSCGKSEWVCEHLGAYADAETIEKAIEESNWEWLSESVWLFVPEMQKRTVLAAAEKGNWKFISDYSGQLNLKDCAMDIVMLAMDAGERAVAAQVAGQHIGTEENNSLAENAWNNRDAAMLGMLAGYCEKAFIEELLICMAREGEWACVEHCVRVAGEECVETLMDIAVDQGDFDAIDMLDKHV